MCKILVFPWTPYKCWVNGYKKKCKLSLQECVIFFLRNIFRKKKKLIYKERFVEET